MDKEMMGKVNELLKANGKRELSLDEMDKVVGGVDPEFEAQAYKLGMTLVDAYPYEIAASVYCDMFGISQREAKNFATIGGASDKDKMSALINRHMKILDNIEEKGHSY